MQNNRGLYRLWVIILLVMGIAWPLADAPAQPFSDYAWGYWGSYRESQRLTREDAVARYNYCPTGGCVLRLDGIEVKPEVARKGETMILKTTYTILTPEQVAIPVAISREIFFEGKSLGKTKNIDTRNLNGTFVHEVNFTLPADAPPGKYTLATRISTGYGMDQKNVEFRVQ